MDEVIGSLRARPNFVQFAAGAAPSTCVARKSSAVAESRRPISARRPELSIKDQASQQPEEEEAEVEVAPPPAA